MLVSRLIGFRWLRRLIMMMRIVVLSRAIVIRRRNQITEFVSPSAGANLLRHQRHPAKQQR